MHIAFLNKISQPRNFFYLDLQVNYVNLGIVTMEF